MKFIAQRFRLIRFWRTTLFGGALLMILSIPHLTTATELPAVAVAGFALDSSSNTGSIVFGPGLGTVSGSGTNRFGSPYSNSAGASIVAGNPKVEVTGTAGSWAQSALSFSYEIIGPANSNVPLILTGTVSATASPVAGGSAEAQINPGFGFSTRGPMLRVCSDLTPACGGGGTHALTGSISFNAAANTVQYIYMFAGIDSQTSSSGSFSAFADPTITIDPNFAQASSYSIRFSPGVRAAPAKAISNPGWWWNPTESGRGFTIEQQGDKIFLAGFLYDVAGRATWYAAGPTAVNGSTFTSTLTEYSGGQSLTGTYRAPTSTRNIGDISITFTDPNHGTLTWPGGTIPIQRYDFGPGGSGATAPLGTPETGWWWNVAEGGRGFSIEIQGGTMFLGGYMYDVFGNPIWYVSGPMAMTNTTTYQGNWNEYGNGQTLAGLYRPANVANANVGAVTLQFSSATTATLTLPNGRQIVLVRYRF